MEQSRVKIWCIFNLFWLRLIFLPTPGSRQNGPGCSVRHWESGEGCCHVLEQSWLDGLRQLVGSPAEPKHGIIDNASVSLAELAEEIHQLSGFPLEPQVRTGDTLGVIAEAASHFDLLVLGARGRHPVRALALGTTSQRLLGKTRQPVLVVKRKPISPYQRVIVAVDFSPNSEKALAYSRAIAPQATVYLVHILESLFEMKMISITVSNEVIKEYRIKAYLEAEAELTRFIKKVGVDPPSFSLCC
ncbi:MAG: Universal stress protein family protein [Syntrophorhabdus sp. PtaU1.Bin153]|nr:MAG: Universal stress protein family protein [Syntrophorhabdus sp. PtaU1.Bin153]